MTDTRIANRGRRQLVMIDIENLAATPSPTVKEVQAVKAALGGIVPGFDDSQRIVACSHHAAPAVAFEFPGARHLWRSGRDGADLALMDVLENEHVDERYRSVIICSGDGIFAEAGAWLAGRSVDVTVIALQGRLAARLQLAVRDVQYLAVGDGAASSGSAG
jgi:hypothetical protein